MERGQLTCQFCKHFLDQILPLGLVAVAQLDLEAADKIGTTIGIIALEALLYIADLASQFGHPTAHPPIGGEHNPACSSKPAQRAVTASRENPVRTASPHDEVPSSETPKLNT